ncbi:MAG: low specificity L-threonine aldolase [Bryobacteraceae bacterium]|nr:low specificity L-threonine aldolase [Bryobacteraceae bacterium]
MIDLRSDTVTKPTAEMRQAMFAAEVGDDVYGEDPTVNRLEEKAAAMLGKEAALFVPTGTMGNTIALKLHTEHGQEIICESRSHIFNYELAMMAWFAGCVARPVAAENGLPNWDQIRREIRPTGPHAAPTGLIEVENTHNMAGGTVYPLDSLREIYEGAHEYHVPVHMDGARLFHAAVFLGIPVMDIARYADTVMFCLSKGLGAPAGSMLVGPRQLIDKGRLYRKRLGGGMRQAGVLAAAGLVALGKMPLRLKEDHDKARLIGSGLAAVPGLRVLPVQTNIVIFDLTQVGLSSGAMSAELRSRGVLANGTGPYAMRMVTHFDVSEAECKEAVEAVHEIAGKQAAVAS